jgi:hypothetical protein
VTLEDAIEQRQRDDQGIKEAVGGRIGWDRSIEGEPAITNQIIADPRPQHYKGFQATRGTSVQVDVWARDPSAARRIREMVIAALTPAATVTIGAATIAFQRAVITNVRGGAEPQQGATSQRARTDMFRESIDFLFLHNA